MSRIARKGSLFKRERGQALLIVCAVALAACSSNDWEIEGTVRSATSSEAVYHAKVALACGPHSLPDPRDMAMQTDERGRFAFSGKGKAPTDCSIKIEEERFVRQETKLSEDAFRKGNGKRFVFDAVLTPRK